MYVCMYELFEITIIYGYIHILLIVYVYIAESVTIVCL